MSSSKRKAFESNLQRRVRARRDPSEELHEGSDASENSIQDTERVAQDEDSDVDREHNTIKKDDVSTDGSEPEVAASISFGALAKAHAVLQRPPKGSESALSRRSKNPVQDDTWEDNEAVERKAGRKDHRDFTRSNKHAPAEISSKKAVSRKREIVAVAKREVRDPRFEPLNGPVDESRINNAYSFLEEYREDEMKALKEQIKKTKDEFEKERLKRNLLSMESRKKAQERKKKAQEILDRHRKEEKELVKQGKKPFYLKKADQKKQFLLDQYSGLKGKQLDHVIERKRKKVEGKEKKKMPFARRDFGA